MWWGYFYYLLAFGLFGSQALSFFGLFVFLVTASLPAAMRALLLFTCFSSIKLNFMGVPEYRKFRAELFEVALVRPVQT